MKFLKKLGSQFLDVEVSSIKIQKISNQSLLQKILNWITEALRDGQTTVISQDPLFAVFTIKRKLDHICY